MELKKLKRFPAELVTEPIEKLLAEKKFSYRIKKRIEELLEPDDNAFWSFHRYWSKEVDTNGWSEDDE